MLGHGELMIEFEKGTEMQEEQKFVHIANLDEYHQISYLEALKELFVASIEYRDEHNLRTKLGFNEALEKARSVLKTALCH